jgi:phosphoribosylglycinamide formyltransferase-1
MASGRGSNLAALLSPPPPGSTFPQRTSPGRFVAFATDKPGCPALAHARASDLAILEFPVTRATKPEFEKKVITHFLNHGVEIVVLCGYMRLVSPEFLRAFPKGVLNIHPSLLPAFPGLDAQRQAFDYGVKITGCTVHLVDDGLDSGPILAQAAVPVAHDDTADSLAAKILAEEHKLYGQTISDFCCGRFQSQGRRRISPNH